METIRRISLVDDYINTKIEGDSELDMCIEIMEKTILYLLDMASDVENINSNQLYNLAHIKRVFTRIKSEVEEIRKEIA